MVNRSKIVHVREVRLPEHEDYVDRRVADVAAERGENLVDFMLDLALAEDLSTRFVYYGLMNGDMDAVSEILKGPYCLPGVSDAGAHLDMDCGVDFTGRFLGHWVREREIMSIEEGVRRLTSMPRSHPRLPRPRPRRRRHGRRPRALRPPTPFRPSRGSGWTTSPAAGGGSCSGPSASRRSSSTARR